MKRHNSKKAVAKLVIVIKSVIYIFFNLISNVMSRGEVLVMAYHSIDRNDSINSVNPEVFRKQIEYLRRNYEIVSLKRIVDFAEKGRAPCRRCVAITFDDGYRDNYLNAYPYLKKNGIPATVFVAVGYVQKEMALNGIPLKMLSWEEILEMSENNISIEAHTVSHPNLQRMNAKDVENEIISSKEEIEKNTGREVNYFCYPSGRYNKEVVDLVKSLGFKGAFGGEGLIKQDEDPFIINRVSVDRSINFYMFKTRLTKALEWYKKVEQTVKIMTDGLPFMDMVSRIYNDKNLMRSVL